MEKNLVKDTDMTPLKDATNKIELVSNSSSKSSKKKVMIEVDEDDPCLQQGDPPLRTVREDPRFQQTDVTLRCYVMYADFYRCEKILGEGTEACAWFKKAYETFCPTRWIENFDDLRTTGRFAWHKGTKQGKFPGYKYGD
ncbi:cytochrome c oxidase subunit 6B2 isoform X2 [Prorops nasuta]